MFFCLFLFVVVWQHFNVILKWNWYCEWRTHRRRRRRSRRMWKKNSLTRKCTLIALNCFIYQSGMMIAQILRTWWWIEKCKRSCRHSRRRHHHHKQTNKYSFVIRNIRGLAAHRCCSKFTPNAAAFRLTSYGKFAFFFLLFNFVRVLHVYRVAVVYRSLFAV